MLKLFISSLILSSSLFAVSYSRDIQPMIDFKKKQEQINYSHAQQIKSLNNVIHQLEKEIQLLYVRVNKEHPPR